MIRLIFLSDFTESYAHNLLRGILEYSRAGEPWAICKMPPYYKQVHGVIGVVEWALQWKADVVIGQFEPTDNVALFARHGILCIGQDFKKRFETVANITGGYKETGAVAAKYFLRKGFINFAFYGYANVVWSAERFEGFKQCLQANNMGGNVYAYEKQQFDYMWYNENDHLVQWLKSLPHPVALMACDDTRAYKVIEECRLLGYKVPEDIAVMGVDDDTTCSLSYPTISTIRLTVVKAGYEAARMIDAYKHGDRGALHNIVVEPVMVVERQSTDIYATCNTFILKALKYIHGHISEEISVEDVVAQVPMSRRLLEMRFKEETGSSVYQYITSLRMDRFSQLLVSSSEPVADIAASVGLTDPKNLSRQFKQKKGLTPLEYRKKFGLSH